MLSIVDIPAESVALFRKFCAAEELEIWDETARGPAGGNPRFVVLAGTADKLAALGRFYFGPARRLQLDR